MCNEPSHAVRNCSGMQTLVENCLFGVQKFFSIFLDCFFQGFDFYCVNTDVELTNVQQFIGGQASKEDLEAIRASGVILQTQFEPQDLEQ